MSAAVGSFKVVEMSIVATEVSAIAEILEAVKVSVVLIWCQQLLNSQSGKDVSSCYSGDCNC